MTRLVTADASRVTPRRFLRHVLGPTQAEIAAAWAAAGAKLAPTKADLQQNAGDN